MDIFHDNAMLAGVRQMLGAFAKQYIRPVAMKHDREESMPWALMKQAQGFGMTQTAVVDGRKALTLRGPGIATDFQAIVEDYVQKRYPRRDGTPVESETVAAQ